MKGRPGEIGEIPFSSGAPPFPNDRWLYPSPAIVPAWLQSRRGQAIWRGYLVWLSPLGEHSEYFQGRVIEVWAGEDPPLTARYARVY